MLTFENCQSSLLGEYAPAQFYREEIYVLKPEGIIIIGRMKSKKEGRTLKVLNS